MTADGAIAHAIITVLIVAGGPAVTVEPAGGPIAAEATLDGHRLRLALRGHGDVEARFHIPVADVDARGGHCFAVPGDPYVVRAVVDGWLSITARLAR